MKFQTDDLRIIGMHELTPPVELHRDYPITETVTETVYLARLQMKQAFSETDKNLVGNLYITDDKLPNPYDSLPPYGDLEIEMVPVTN